MSNGVSVRYVQEFELDIADKVGKARRIGHRPVSDRGILSLIGMFHHLRWFLSETAQLGGTHGKDVVTLELASLGHLARGASAMKTGRHKKPQEVYMIVRPVREE